MSKLKFTRPVLSGSALAGVLVGVVAMAALLGGQAPSAVDSVHPAGVGATATTSASTPAAAVGTSPVAAPVAGTGAPAAAAVPGAPAAASTITTGPAPQAPAAHVAPGVAGAPAAAAVTTTVAPVAPTPTASPPPPPPNGGTPYCYDKGGKAWYSGAGCTVNSPDYVETRY